MRNFVVSLALVTAALAVGCSRSEKADASASSAAAPAENAAPAESGAPTEPVSAAPAKPYAGIDYDCGGGTSFNAKLDKGNALVTLDGKTATLAPSSGIGAMYAGEGLTYIPRGEEATLIKDGQAPQNCKAKS